MSLKLTYDQVPHIIINHPLMTNDSEIVFRNIFKILKDKQKCIYSNSALAKASRISLRTLDKCLQLLESIGAIIRTGLKQNRRIYRGLLLSTSANVAYENKKESNINVYQLNTCAADADACAADADACAADADILRTTIKNFTTKTSEVVVIISEEKDKRISDAYQKHGKQIKSEDIKNAEDLIQYFKWSIEKGEEEGIHPEGRYNQLIKFTLLGDLRIDLDWKKQFNSVLRKTDTQLKMDYQDYFSKTKNDISLKILPPETKLLTLIEWVNINAK